MTVLQWLRLGAGGLLILAGLFVFISALIGNFRFPDALTRMHAAALGDTMGITLVFAGVSVLCFAWDFVLKMAAVIVLLWIASPTGSHLIARMITDREKRDAEEMSEK